MFYQIASFLIDVLAGLLTGACLLRAYMQWHRIPFANPVGKLVFALTDWLVLPLRKAMPYWGKLDLSCLVAALLLQWVQYLMLWMMLPVMSAWAVTWLGAMGVLRIALSGMAGLLLVFVILSWVQPHSPLSQILSRLVEPLLRPLRKVMPMIGGIDFSPLVLLLLLQVALIVLANVRGMGMGW